jgi:hypothetical protein
LAVNARAISLLSDLNEICFIGTNKAELVCHSGTSTGSPIQF